MQVIPTDFEDLYIIQPKCFEDDRGYFFESYNENEFKKNGLNLKFVQDNQSLSHKNVLRGMHFQHPPFAQGKLVRVIKGAVFDVVIDLRKKSPTFGKYFSIELNEHNKTMLYVPEGFAHGFLTLEDNTIFFYKCTNFYNKAAEDCIIWNDPAININWGISNPLVSEKDSLAKPLSEINILF
ncbi:MAG: dTDP-4-dehydrorhamnose 3,5-epimerase [Bacteroidia bacterium]